MPFVRATNLQTQVIDALLILTEDESDYVRVAALEALPALCDREPHGMRCRSRTLKVVTLLYPPPLCLTDDTPAETIHLCSSAATVHGYRLTAFNRRRHFLQAIVARCSDDDPDARGAAISSLSMLACVGDKTAVDLALAALEDPGAGTTSLKRPPQIPCSTDCFINRSIDGIPRQAFARLP